MGMIVGFLKLITAVGALLAFIVLLKNGFLMVREILPGTRLIRDLYGSSVNVIFLKHFLTDKGREYRRKVIIHGCLVFPLACFLVVLDGLH